MKRRLWIHGYSLLEASFGLIILGLITATLIPTIQNFKRAQHQKKTDQRSASIKERLEGYYQNKKSFPCPASPAAANTDAWGYAAPSCSRSHDAAIGLVPFKTLGLLERDAQDGFGHPFTYVIEPHMTHQKKLNPSTKGGVPEQKKAVQFHEKGKALAPETASSLVGLIISHGPKGIGSFIPAQGARKRKKGAQTLHPEKQENASDSPNFYIPSQGAAGLNDDQVTDLRKPYERGIGAKLLGPPSEPSSKKSAFQKHT